MRFVLKILALIAGDGLRFCLLAYSLIEIAIAWFFPVLGAAAATLRSHCKKNDDWMDCVRERQKGVPMRNCRVAFRTLVSLAFKGIRLHTCF